jgi:hypothetical protein
MNKAIRSITERVSLRRPIDAFKRNGEIRSVTHTAWRGMDCQNCQNIPQVCSLLT